MALTTETARTLAVSYEAYIDATNRSREATNRADKRAALHSICVWARVLMEAQCDTGVSFHKDSHLEDRIRWAEADLRDMDMGEAA